MLTGFRKCLAADKLSLLYHTITIATQSINKGVSMNPPQPPPEAPTDHRGLTAHVAFVILRETHRPDGIIKFSGAVQGDESDVVDVGVGIIVLVWLHCLDLEVSVWRLSSLVKSVLAQAHCDGFLGEAAEEASFWLEKSCLH